MRYTFSSPPVEYIEELTKVNVKRKLIKEVNDNQIPNLFCSLLTQNKITRSNCIQLVFELYIVSAKIL